MRCACTTVGTHMPDLFGRRPDVEESPRRFQTASISDGIGSMVRAAGGVLNPRRDQKQRDVAKPQVLHEILQPFAVRASSKMPAKPACPESTISARTRALSPAASSRPPA
jgi:hypothetical protein